MAGTVAASKESPRFDDNKDVLYWFTGDAFTLDWTLNLVDEETGAEHRYQDTDQIIISFFDVKKKLIHQFVFDHITSNEVHTEITPEISSKFPAGLYSYCIKYKWNENGTERIQTIIDNKKIKVESCH